MMRTNNVENLALQENIEHLTKITQQCVQAKVKFTTEYADVLKKNHELIKYISEALPYVLEYVPTKEYFDLIFKYASTTHESSYDLVRGFRVLNNAKLLDIQTAELMCKRPHIEKILRQLLIPSPENLLTKDNVMLMLENDMISNNYKKLETILNILGSHSEILTQRNFDCIIEILDNIEELALAFKKYEPTAYDYLAESWNPLKISQEEFNNIISPIRAKREQEIRATLSKADDAEAVVSTQGFFAKPDSRIIPENGIVDIICHYSR